MKNNVSFREKCLLTILSIILGLILSECIARLYFYLDYNVFINKSVKFKNNDKNSYRIAILGESTSRGFPYNMVDVYYKEPYDFYLPTFTKIILEKYYNQKEIIIDPFCEGGWTIKQSVEYYFKNVKYKPNLIIIIAGFNEVPCYYSPNMDEIPFFLLPLSKIKVGELILRAIYIKPVVEDTRYKGDFFSKKIIPDFERERIERRYEKYLKMIAIHATKEKIPLIIISPDGNYLFPPTRSIYNGPKEKKNLALQLFKKAFYYKYFENNIKKAKEILLKIKEFASFADLYFELGEIYYIENDYENAEKHLRTAIDIDGYPFIPSSNLRDICKRIAENYNFPFIDMHDVITKRLNAKIPDYNFYIDNAHLKLIVYFELNKAILEIMDKYNFFHFLPDFDNAIKKINFNEAIKFLHIPSDLEKKISYNSLEWFDEQSNYFFIKYRFYSIMLKLKQIVDNKGVFPDLENRFYNEKRRLLKWIQE